VQALFPDVTDPADVLHVFSGSLPAGPYVRCDSLQDAELRCSVYDLAATTPAKFRLVLADPPYSAADAVKYGTPMVDRRRAMAALAGVVEPGGFVVWLDQVWPMHSKREWVTVGRILLQRSTNHRVRVVSIFERVALAATTTGA
jgi:16S rRNA G966 N2-methylase RsmD